MAVYGTTSGADSYHAARGNSTWVGSDATKEIALLRASDYVDIMFRDQFPGEKTGLRTQEREWPREWAFDKDGEAIGVNEIPVEVINATYEAALRELVAPGSLMPDVTLGKQIKSASVDGAVSVEYAGATGLQGMRPTVSVVGGILAPILTGYARSSIAGQAVRG